eukprot:CAMPEP_0167814458 /NCGR_PEP_ID=MMETSP0112_2-20121227/2437_1 /TAXON_ID=91324 /ORGANISM="Lotharella globosa, Strain CCCM811" /LENGTH=49 /DNA_ID=CAMNT_0007713687 /DNA_START=619 /DNA_END=768 /DNA_ORIENTATION=+
MCIAAPISPIAIGSLPVSAYLIRAPTPTTTATAHEPITPATHETVTSAA